MNQGTLFLFKVEKRCFDRCKISKISKFVSELLNEKKWGWYDGKKSPRKV